jgi:hypothetical protein
MWCLGFIIFTSDASASEWSALWSWENAGKCWLSTVAVPKGLFSGERIASESKAGGEYDLIAPANEERAEFSAH